MRPARVRPARVRPARVTIAASVDNPVACSNDEIHERETNQLRATTKRVPFLYLGR